jgi:hypothetical protein
MQVKRASITVLAVAVSLVVGGCALTQNQQTKGSTQRIQLEEANVVTNTGEYLFRIEPRLATRSWGGVFSSRFDWRAMAAVTYQGRGNLRPLKARMMDDSSGSLHLFVEPPQFADYWSLQLSGNYVEELRVPGYSFVIQSNRYHWAGPYVTNIVKNNGRSVAGGPRPR